MDYISYVPETGHKRTKNVIDSRWFAVGLYYMLHRMTFRQEHLMEVLLYVIVAISTGSLKNVRIKNSIKTHR